jgi:hypothetical protein
MLTPHQLVMTKMIHQEVRYQDDDHDGSNNDTSRLKLGEIGTMVVPSPIKPIVKYITMTCKH